MFDYSLKYAFLASVGEHEKTPNGLEEFDLEKTHADLEKSLVCSSGKFHEVLCIWGSDLKEIGPRDKVRAGVR